MYWRFQVKNFRISQVRLYIVDAVPLNQWSITVLLSEAYTDYALIAGLRIGEIITLDVKNKNKYQILPYSLRFRNWIMSTYIPYGIGWINLNLTIKILLLLNFYCVEVLSVSMFGCTRLIASWSYHLPLNEIVYLHIEKFIIFNCVMVILKTSMILTIFW